MLDGVQWPSTGESHHNIALYVRVRAHTTGVLCFLLSQVSHKLYKPLCNNHLHWFQKQHPTLSHFHATTPPPKTSQNTILNLTIRPPIQNNPSLSTKRHVVFSKTIRCFQQNDTMFLVKQHVVFGMMKYFQPHPLWHLWQQKKQNS